MREIPPIFNNGLMLPMLSLNRRTLELSRAAKRRRLE
jgi:hypothetical protein